MPALGFSPPAQSLVISEDTPRRAATVGTWIKETDKAIYLMDGNNWISRVSKNPSKTNPKEQVVDIQGLRSWFTRADRPKAMTVSVGTGAPEPEPITATPSQPGGSGNGGGSSHKGMQLRVVGDTYFKLANKPASQLSDSQKVSVKKGSTFDIEYYTDVGSSHWRIELLNPSIGDGRTTAWYVYVPDTELISDTQLTVTQDTVFKREPKMSSQLPESSKISVKKGTQLKLKSFLPAADKHSKVELAEAATLGTGEQTIWYVYNPHIKIEGQRQLLETVSDTFFKAKPIMSSQLLDSEKIFVKNKTVFEVNSYAQPASNHVKVAMQGAYLGPSGRNTWYCFVPDIMISGTEIGNRPDDNNPSSGQSPDPVDRGFSFTLPGFSGTYYSKDPIYWKTQYNQKGNFTWAEALHFDANGNYRRPANSGVVYGILRVAKVMEEIRRKYGNVPVQINSWYRDPATNAAVGGASQSRHMSGDAVDFVIGGIHPYDVYANLDGWWGSKGGLASSTVFTHIDVRGYRARWDYGY